MKRVIYILMALTLCMGCGRVKSWQAKQKARRAKEKAIVVAGVAQRRSYLERHILDDIRSSIPESFYTYSGFRDWWRLPLVFPYQLMFIDTRDSAYLEKYDPKHPVADPNKSSSGVLGGITHIATDSRTLVFETTSGAATSYGMLQYGSGTRSEYSDEEEMWSAAKKAGYSGENRLLAVDDLFSAYYDYKKDFVEQSPGGDSLKAAPQE